MRIAVLRTQVPFVTGGAERHAARLVRALEERGHRAVEVTVPFKWYPGETLAQSVLAAKLIDASEVEGVPVDLAVGLKFPAWLARHPRKVFWVIHQHRQAYDMWESGQSDLLRDPDGAALRQMILEEDRLALGASRRPVFANSRNVAARLRRFNGIEAQPLYHPPPLAERLSPGAQGDYLFAPGRINPSKRLELMIDALAAAGRGPRLVVAGTAENPAYEERLRGRARERGVEDRVEWLGAIDDETLLRRYAEARAVVFVPRDEDYGYITLEAMLSAKPVITVEDAGGPLEFVRHEQEGLVTAPKPGPLGRAFSRLTDDAALAERLGAAGHARYASLGIAWDTVVAHLLGEAGAPALPDAPPPSQDATPDRSGAPDRSSAPGRSGASDEPGARATDPARGGADLAAPGDAPAPKEAAEAASEAPSAERTAVARLADAVAPPEPPDVGFPSIRAVLEAYRFDAAEGEGAPGTVDEGLAAYLETHWTRYLATLATLGDLAPRTILDVGIFPPLAFEALLANRYPEARLLGLWEGPEPSRQRIEPRAPGRPPFEVALEAGNGERDRWPFADGSVDLVLGMEILEHLALDPYFFFCEANRVLAEGGHLLLTTPNVISHRGVWKALTLRAPYSFGIFVPTGGVYGRHNREYAPQELPLLGEAAGFETVSLATHDVYDRKVDPGIAELLAGRPEPLEFRGETIFYLARKEGGPTGAPARLYHGDPARMSGRLAREEGAAPGHARVAVTNTSPVWWTLGDGRATLLLAEWIDADGAFQDYLVFAGPPAPVAPGETVRLDLPVAPAGPGETAGRIRLHLFQQDVGVFSGTGRAPPLMLDCAREAYLRLPHWRPAA